MDANVTTAFGGSGDIDLFTFLDRVTVWTELKNFQGEKKALALESRLEGAAFDNYLRLSVDDKKTFNTIVHSPKRERIVCKQLLIYDKENAL